MLPFEKDVIDLLKINGISYTFDPLTHYLLTKTLHIQFEVNCSTPINTNTDKPHLKKLTNTAFTLHLWEDVYFSHAPVVNSRILSMLGISQRIHARSTLIKPISQDELTSFIRMNHLNTPTKVKYKLGMFADKKLVAVAAFGRSCPIQVKGKTYISHELIRFCSLLNHTVVGGLSKFIQYFINNVKPEHIMTSVDREWSTGKSYQKLGFTIDGYTTPQSFWLSPDDCSRHYASDALKERTPEQLVEEGWKEVKNLGNIKLVKFI